jgi:hypothetical protein
MRGLPEFDHCALVDHQSARTYEELTNFVLALDGGSRF